MNAPIPIRTENPFAGLSDDVCDYCSATPVATVFDGEQFCAACADKWVPEDGPHEDEIAELERSLRHAGVYRGALIEARLSDAKLSDLSRQQRKFQRENRT